MNPMVCPRCWGAKTEPGSDGANPCILCNGAGTIPDTQLTPHFKLSECLYSQTAIRFGIPNDPTADQVGALTKTLTAIAEPVRGQFGPLHIDSGLRQPALNTKVGGSLTSAHRFGYAVDMVPVDTTISRKSMVDWIIANVPAYDQVIFEGTWVHGGLFSPTMAQRKQALTMFPDSSGTPTYQPYDPNDPRVASL
jgi:zinc D-Ala-D-Ala carboxypeptidase